MALSKSALCCGDGLLCVCVYKTLIFVHANNSHSNSSGRLKVRPVLVECFGHCVSLFRAPLDLYSLPGTISLSLPILYARHYCPCMTVTDFGAKASVLIFSIIHPFFSFNPCCPRLFCKPPKLSISECLEGI